MTMAHTLNALSTTVVCVIVLDIFSDSDVVFSEAVVVPRLAWGLTELLDGNIVRGVHWRSSLELVLHYQALPGEKQALRHLREG